MNTTDNRFVEEYSLGSNARIIRLSTATCSRIVLSSSVDARQNEGESVSWSFCHPNAGGERAESVGSGQNQGGDFHRTVVFLRVCMKLAYSQSPLFGATLAPILKCTVWAKKTLCVCRYLTLPLRGFRDCHVPPWRVRLKYLSGSTTNFPRPKGSRRLRFCGAKKEKNDSAFHALSVSRPGARTTHVAAAGCVLLSQSSLNPPSISLVVL